VLVLLSYAYVPLVHAGYGLCYAGLIIFLFRDGGLKRLFEKPLFIWLGERSYSLFLTHFSVLYLLNYLVSHITPGRNIVYGILTRTLAFPLCMLAAMLLFHFVERRYAKGLQTANAFWPWDVLPSEKPDTTEAVPDTFYTFESEPAARPSFSLKFRG
jgi:peptidoglycan/LPS O-acetylase OafA/YrhL